MRELKGDWKDLFNGFMLALDLRKMFLGFCGIVFTLFGPIAATCWTANQIDSSAVPHLESYGLHDLWAVIRASFGVIYCGTQGHPADWQLWLPHLLAMLVSILAIWAYFGGAISRIAAYEIAKDGERIETARALQFARRKFWAFFMSPWVCLIGFGFFFVCCWAGGLLGRVLDFIWIGGPLVAILLPLALLAGFVMTLIGLGTAAGFPLFAPAVAAEGTDAFDAMSRGFSYVYSRPWHYVFYQLVAALYGVICVSFVLLFAVTLCHAGLVAGGAGFDMFGVAEAPKVSVPILPKNPAPEQQKAWEKEAADFHREMRDNPDKYGPQYDRFRHITDAAWAMILTNRYDNDRFYLGIGGEHDKPGVYFCGGDEQPSQPVKYVYGRLMRSANCIVKPDHSMTIGNLQKPSHRVAAYIVVVWLIIALGLTLGYIPSYVLSQQTLIYGLLRKRVDGIEMNEVFEETDEEPLAAEPPKAPEPSKPVPPPPPPPPKA
jgi:hypothetical protein